MRNIYIIPKACAINIQSESLIATSLEDNTLGVNNGSGDVSGGLTHHQDSFWEYWSE